MKCVTLFSSVIPAEAQRKAGMTSAFTLLEMSIVLAIIGLLTGAIIVGQDMIRSSQLQAVTGEVAKYTQAIHDFQDKYQALPGDFSNAEAFWGSDASCPSTPYTATPHTATCNGNGDGHLGTGVSGYPLDYETYRAWQQLADAGLIDGQFNGISGTGSSYNSLIGINVPASKLSGAGYTVLYVYMPTGNADNWPVISHMMQFGSSVTNQQTYGAVLTASEALAMDNKLDDGLPAYGTIQSGKSAIYPNCTTSDTASSSQYNTSYSGIACGLFFLTDF